MAWRDKDNPEMEFNMNLAVYQEIRRLLNMANFSWMRKEYSIWFDTLYRIYLEVCPIMKQEELDNFERRFKAIEEMDLDLINQHGKVIGKNYQKLVEKSRPLERDLRIFMQSKQILFKEKGDILLDLEEDI